jgi:hypothetical protein
MTHSPGGEFQAGGKPAPPWLAKLARGVSGIPRVLDTEDEAALLSNVFEQTAASASDTVYSPYDRVWKHFFPPQELANEPRAEQGSAVLINE